MHFDLNVSIVTSSSQPTPRHEGAQPLRAIHMIGNAHLDPAWMWDWGEGMEAFLATVRSALDRMEETPGFIFTCSSAAHYRWIEEVEPDLFERVRARVAEGRWTIAGGWWVQADCNIPSGEGFVRQALLGQRYFMSRFGRIARTGYSPDAFGHNLGLPQLLARAGMSGYIFCRPDPTELVLPSPLIRWTGPDGSSVLAYRVPFHYNMYESSVPKKVADLKSAHDGGSDLAPEGAPLSSLGGEWMLFYGVGNHGGGPTREHIAQILAIDADASEPGTIFSDPDRYFERVVADPAFVIPTWRDDLQLNAPGCYSAHSAIKKLNRASEHRLMAAERISSLAALLRHAPYPAEELERAWESVCFNHFHDILCGVAIREALDDATAMYGEALAIAARSIRYGLQRLARGIDTTGAGSALLLFNSHAWEIDAPVTFELWHDIDKALWERPVHVRVTTDDGRELPCQIGFTSGKIGRDRIAVTFRGDAPALGWRTYRVFYGEKSLLTEPACSVGNAPAPGGSITVDNGIVRMEIAPEGLVSIHDGRHGRELLSGPSALPIAIDDPTDTWGHGRTIFDRIIGKFDAATLDVVENGPTHATVRSISRWNNSWVQQDFRLYRGSPNIHVDVKVFWGEHYTMLKLEFSPHVDNPRALFESAYCVTEKPCDGVERPGGSWCALVGEGSTAGLALINDAKHGYSAAGSTIAMTLLRSPSFATHDPHPFHPHEDLDFLDQGVQRFSYIIAPLDGGGTSELWRHAMLLNAPLIPHLESAHPPAGAQGRQYRGARVFPETVIMPVLKRSEDGNGWIARLFETAGLPTRGSAHVDALGISWSFELAPYEIATVLLRDGAAVPTTLTEMEG